MFKADNSLEVALCLWGFTGFLAVAMISQPFFAIAVAYAFAGFFFLSGLFFTWCEMKHRKRGEA